MQPETTELDCFVSFAMSLMTSDAINFSLELELLMIRHLAELIYLRTLEQSYWVPLRPFEYVFTFLFLLVLE